jgi:hypothetical protein
MRGETRGGGPSRGWQVSWKMTSAWRERGYERTDGLGRTRSGLAGDDCILKSFRSQV